MIPVPQSMSRIRLGCEMGAWKMRPCISSCRAAAWSSRRMWWSSFRTAGEGGAGGGACWLSSAISGMVCSSELYIARFGEGTRTRTGLGVRELGKVILLLVSIGE